MLCVVENSGMPLDLQLFFCPIKNDKLRDGGVHCASDIGLVQSRCRIGAAAFFLTLCLFGPPVLLSESAWCPLEFHLQCFLAIVLL